MAPTKAPTKQRAAIVSDSGSHSASPSLADMPKPGPGQILVKVVATAQNPTDWKSLGRVLEAKYDGIIGNDFAGVVEELGPDAPEGVWTVGERVAGGILRVGTNGAFSEYLVADAELQIVPIPIGWSFEEAAQLGVAPLSGTNRRNRPVHRHASTHSSHLGGTSAIGQYAIQFAKLGELRVLTTASSKNFDLVKGLGADKVFDYRDEGVVEKIRAATGNALNIAIDTISERKTPEQITGGIGDKGGKVAIINPYESPRPGVKVTFSMLTDLLRRVRLRSSGKWYVDLFKKIFVTGNVKPIPVFI